MANEYADLVPRRITDNHGHSRILFEGRVWAKSEGLAPASAARSRPTSSTAARACATRASGCADMDEEGIDVAVDLRHLDRPHGQRPPGQGTRGAICHAVNAGWWSTARPSRSA